MADYVLAKLVTGLPAELLDLIGGDQVSDEAILGCPVPERARAVLRALEDRQSRCSSGPGSVAGSLPAMQGTWMPADQAFATAVGWILRNPGHQLRIPLTNI